MTLPVSVDSEIVNYTSFQHTSEAIVGVNEGVVLSGMIREIRERTRSGTPGLSKLPILGFFFGNRGRMIENEELMVIAVPNVPKGVLAAPVRTSDDAARVLECAMTPGSRQRIAGDDDVWENKWGKPVETDPLIYPRRPSVLMGEEIRPDQYEPPKREARTIKTPSLPAPRRSRNGGEYGTTGTPKTERNARQSARE